MNTSSSYQQFKIGFSVHIGIWLIVLTTTVIILLALLPILWLWKVIFISLAFIIAYRLKINRYQDYKLVQLPSYRWQLESPQQEIFAGNLQGSTIVTKQLCLIVLKDSVFSKSKRIPIFADSLPKDQFHQLKLCLRGYLP